MPPFTSVSGALFHTHYCLVGLFSYGFGTQPRRRGSTRRIGVQPPTPSRNATRGREGVQTNFNYTFCPEGANVQAERQPLTLRRAARQVVRRLLAFSETASGSPRGAWVAPLTGCQALTLAGPSFRRPAHTALPATLASPGGPGRAQSRCPQARWKLPIHWLSPGREGGFLQQFFPARTFHRCG